MPTKAQLKRFAPAVFRSKGLEVVPASEPESKDTVAAETVAEAAPAPEVTAVPEAPAPEAPVADSAAGDSDAATSTDPAPEAPADDQPQMPDFANMTVKDLKARFSTEELDALPDLRKDTLIAAAEQKWMATSA